MRFPNFRALLVCSAVAFAFAACSSDPAAEVRELEKEVMAIHDEVMPEMTKISTLRVQLKKVADDSTSFPEMHEQIVGHIEHLELADSLMWKWMHAYQRPDYDDGIDAVKAYLTDEKVSISNVKDEMLESIENAESLLEQLKDEQ